MFTLVDKPFPITIPGISFSKKPLYAVPNGSGRIDVVNKFKWKNAGSTEEVPSITLIEYELEFGAWAQTIARLADTAINWAQAGKLDPYAILYNAQPTNFEYYLPLLLKDGDKIRSIRNSWGDTKFGFGGDSSTDSKSSGSSSGFANFAGKIGSGVIGLAGEVGEEPVLSFGGTAQETITITFPLYNTVTTKSAYDNYQLVSLLTFQNLKTRNTFLTYIPPKIYRVKTQNCLGGLDWPAAYVEALDIESIGTTRELSEYGNTTILTPEAYKVTITLKQLVASSSNIFAGALGHGSVNVIGNLKGTLEDAAKTITDYFDKK
jgi:hypothetical protein